VAAALAQAPGPGTAVVIADPGRIASSSLQAGGGTGRPADHRAQPRHHW
jgi:hypothetical protein